MADRYLKGRFNIPYKYYQQNGHDGEDTLYLPVQIIKGFGTDEIKNVINYKGDEYQSGSQLYFDGDNLLARKIRGGDFLENEFTGKVVVQAVRQYYKRRSRDQIDPQIELVVVFL